MARPVDMQINIPGDQGDLYDVLGDHISARINAYVDAEGICSILLSGGSTPMPLYRLLATKYREEIPWGQVHLFWGDERFVERSRDESNYKTIVEAFEPAGLMATQLHPIPVAYQNTAESAAAYEHELRMWFVGATPVFNITLLGIGSDGHVASLFPDTDAISEKTKWVVPGKSPHEPKDRISVTLPAINASSEVHFVVSGEGKAEVVGRLVQSKSPSRSLPASLVSPASGILKLWLDTAAAVKLTT